MTDSTSNLSLPFEILSVLSSSNNDNNASLGGISYDLEPAIKDDNDKNELPVDNINICYGEIIQPILLKNDHDKNDEEVWKENMLNKLQDLISRFPSINCQEIKNSLRDISKSRYDQ